MWLEDLKFQLTLYEILKKKIKLKIKTSTIFDLHGNVLQRRDMMCVSRESQRFLFTLFQEIPSVKASNLDEVG